MIDLNEMTVLIVDDIITMCKSIHRMMKTIGYGSQFFYAYNGKEALRLLRKEPIDLILMDYNMPEMQGGEALNIIRNDRILRDIPVIMITAQAYTDYVAEAAESYVDALILKPLTIKLLANKVTDVVSKANDPPPIVAHLKRARDFEDEGELDMAIEEAQQAMELDPDSSRAIRELGHFHLKKENLEEAEKWLLQAAQMNEMDVIAFHNLGELYLKQDEIDKAHHYFEKAMEISPRHLDRGINFGKTLVQRKMIPRAIKVFTQAFKFSKEPLVLQEEVADFCCENGAHNYAASLFEGLISKLPQRSDLLFKLGKTWESVGNVKKALPYLIEAEKNDEENLEIKLHLARDYVTIGKPIWAERALKRLLKLDADHKEAQELLKSCIKM